jgi:hypothetical protein
VTQRPIYNWRERWFAKTGHRPPKDDRKDRRTVEHRGQYKQNKQKQFEPESVII